MVRIEQIAHAALAGDALRLRSIVQDWLADHPLLATEPAPESTDPTVRAAAAALIELLAHRLHQSPPHWARTIGPAPQPTYLLAAARTMPRLRRLCETESPPPLRCRNLFAPPTYLESA